jgi:hypothetical protein
LPSAMRKQAPYGGDLNSFWAHDAIVCASMPSGDRGRDVVGATPDLPVPAYRPIEFFRSL